MESLIHVVNGSALVTACTAATSLSLSANNVGFGAQVTLSWSGAAGGAGNPIRGYEVYRDGALLTTVFDGINCAVTSPAGNGSYRYTVKTLGRIAGFDSPVSTASATLTSNVTACAAATSLSLSANNVGFGAQVTLSWSGAQGGSNNGIRGYEVYRDGALLTTATGASCAVTSPSSNGSYRYTVKTLGNVTGFDSPVSSASATLTTNVTAPSKPAPAFTTAKMDYDGSALSWPKASAGANNVVSKYEVQEQVYNRDGSVAASWRQITNANGSAISNTTTGTSITVYAPTIIGQYKLFRVRAQGSAGVHSGYGQASGRATKIYKLFWNGDQCTARTGGWKVRNSDEGVIESGALHLYSTGSSSIQTKSTVTRDGARTLYADFITYDKSYAYEEIQFRIAGVTKYIGGKNLPRQTTSSDISSAAGTKTIAEFYGFMEARTYRIWLE